MGSKGANPMIIKIRGIKQTTVKGRRYYYHRTTKKKPGHTITRRAHGSSTWGALVEAYRASAKYQLLGERTKSDYDKVIAYLAALNDMPLIQFDAETCEKIRDKALQDKKRRFANYVVHMLSLVLGWGKTHREFGHYENGTAGLGKFAAPGDANRPWTVDECRIVVAEAKGALKAAIALGMFAGMRGGDVVCTRWSAYNGAAIQWQQNKTSDPVWKPARRMLREILDAMPRIGETIVAGPDGRPWAEGTLRSNFRDLIRKLEDEGQVGKGITFHGLRSTNAIRLADAGADVRAIQAELGQRTASMALHHSRWADMKRPPRRPPGS
jgi:integrase